MAAAAAATSLRGGSNSNGNGNGSGNTSRSSSSSSACSRIASSGGGTVVTVSPSHTLDYDCTDCGSFLFGHRGRIRPAAAAPARSHGANNNQPRTSTSNGDSNISSHPHGHRNSLGEPAQAHAQRLVLAAPQYMAPSPAGDSATTVGSYMLHAIGLSSNNDVSEPVSLQASDEDVDEAANARVALNYVACDVATTALPCDNVNDSASTLAEIFRCFICLGKVVDAQLCPCCSKLVCHPCIKRWLTDQKSECPHCRAPLLVSQLEVEKIQGKLGDSPMEKLCPAHDSPLLYFCTTCSVAVCSDCAVLIEDHRNHTFEKLSVAYGRHKKKIRMEAAGLRRRRKELSALVTSVDKNIEAVLKSKDESAAELQMTFKRMQSRLEEQLKCKLLALLAQKGSMTQEMELLDTILHELDQQLNSIPKSDLIAQEPNMSRMLQDIRTRTFSEISRTPIPPEFTSEVVPSYEHGELMLKNYREHLVEPRPTVVTSGGDLNNSSEVLLSSRDVVYSESVCASGVAWRLKVYPNGSGASQGTHLSVFLEMVEGGNEAATYEYGIELLHRTRPNQRIVRKFSSEFEAGACWGYYQFFRIDLLEKEGYLQPGEDTITLRFYIRPLTYRQQCQDLRRSLAALQVERDESASQVAVIRRAFAATFFQRRRRRSSRTAGHITNDQQLAFNNPQARKLTHMPSIHKHVQMKMKEFTSTRPAGNNNKWLSAGMWPQADAPEPEPEPEDHPQILEASSTQQDNPALNDNAALNDISALNDNPFAEFLTQPSEEEDGNGTAGAPSIENINTRLRPKDKEQPWKTAEAHSKGEEYFQIPRIRSHNNKKLRSRKQQVQKLLLAPESLLPFTTGLPSTAGLAHNLASLSVVEAGPSSKKSVNSASLGNSVNFANSVDFLDSGKFGISGNMGNAGNCGVVVSSSESANGDERSEDGRGSYNFDEEAKGGQSCTVATVTPEVATVTIVEMSSNVVEEGDKYPYYSSMSGSRNNNFCSPEIEDWGNLK